MRISKTIVSLVLLGLLQCASLTSAKGVSSYIYTPERTLPNNILKELPDATLYTDKELKNLVLHNLNLANGDEDFSQSSKKLIQEYGNKNLIKSQKLNFAILLEGKPLSSFKSAHKHSPVSFDICNNDNSSECVLNHLYNDENSVLRNLKKQSRRQNPEAYFYSSNPHVGSDFGKATLRTAADKKGNIYVIDQSSNKQFKVAENLNTCINTILKGQYEVDLKSGVVSKNGAPLLSMTEDKREHLVNYLHDLCSVVGVSSLVRKDAHPSFLTFHVDSLHNLAQHVPEGDHAVLHQMFNVAYEKFLENLLAHYGADELSGQVIILNPENAIRSSNQENILIELPSGHYKQRGRILADVTNTTTTTSSSSTKIIFGGVLIVFAIVMAWVCGQLFNMEIQKDSVVYAKFLAADYFKR